MLTELTDYELDPRPDLFADHAEWAAILDMAHQEGDEIWGILHGLRCGGAKLSAHATYGLVIERGEWGEEAYKAHKAEHLTPRSKQVLRLLFSAGTRVRKEIEAGWKRPTTLKEYVAARVKAVEGRLVAAGWTRDEVWKEGDFKAQDGHMTQSVYQTLLNDQCWTIGEVKAESVEFRWGPRGHEAANRLYRVSPAVGEKRQATLMGESLSAG